MEFETFDKDIELFDQEDSTSTSSAEGFPSGHRQGFLRLFICVCGWFLGTFLLSIFVVVDELSPEGASGNLLYVILLVSPIVTFVSSFAAPIARDKQGFAFVGSFVVMFVQFFVLAIYALETNGFAGVQ